MTRAAVLAGFGTCLPARLVTNEELAARVGRTDAWIRARTGIERRYFAPEGTSTADLATGAGAQALKCSGVPQADTVVLATVTPDRPCRAVAPVVASGLGLHQAAAYDVSAGFGGFLYGLATAAGLIGCGAAERALVIGADTLSRRLDPADRPTAVSYGDGAGAVLLRAGEPDEPGALGPVSLGSDGEGTGAVSVRDGDDTGTAPAGTAPAGTAPGHRPGRWAVRENRRAFWLGVQRMAQSAQCVLDRAGWPAGDVSHLVTHQANHRIVERLADELGIPRERGICNISEVGNTATASLPLTLGHAHAARLPKPGDRVLLTAFGGGLTWGATVLTWPAIDRD
uniref:Putative 3-oxoacyl-ACP synthase n=1 Tax=Streptomyces griseoviridis TaxID=45398 RepID=B6VRS1_STRGD|nr:putative 3-oxoacyl-ACP synthase [Streptomyces griseoviridis]